MYICGMKTRKEVQSELLKSIIRTIDSCEKRWGDIAVLSPKKGKNSWTYREMYNAIKEDKPLEGSELNEIDSMMRYYEWKEKKKNK